MKVYRNPKNFLANPISTIWSFKKKFAESCMLSSPEIISGAQILIIRRTENLVSFMLISALPSPKLLMFFGLVFGFLPWFISQEKFKSVAYLPQCFVYGQCLSSAIAAHLLLSISSAHSLWSSRKGGHWLVCVKLRDIYWIMAPRAGDYAVGVERSPPGLLQQSN